MNKKTIFPILISCAFFLSSCGQAKKDFSSYKSETISYCNSYVDETTSGWNRVCNLNPVRTSTNKSVYPFDSDLIYASFPLQELDVETIYDIEDKMGGTFVSLHKEFDRHYDYLNEDQTKISNLKVLNESYGTNKAIHVDKDLYDLLKLSVDLGVFSNNRFNIAIGDLSSFWDEVIAYNNDQVSSRYYIDPLLEDEESLALKTRWNQLKQELPTAEELKELLVFDDQNQTVTFKKYKNVERVSLTLGGIGKGYAVGKAAEKLISAKYDYGFISGASSSNIMLGNRKDNTPWTIGISSPFQMDFDMGGYLTLDGYSLISTSGDSAHMYYLPTTNNQYIIRHHIINPATGESMNEFRKVTLVSKTISSQIMDALSTIMMNTKEEDLKDTFSLIRSTYGDIEGIFQKNNEDETIGYYYVTKGLKDQFTVNEENTHLSEVFSYEF